MYYYNYVLKAAFRLYRRARETASSRVAHRSGTGTSSPKEWYGDEEGGEALFDDAPPPGDEEEEGDLTKTLT